jgi:uncharacterized protein (TIGR00251 family)
VEKLSSNVYKIILWVQPGAKKNSIEGIYQGCLKVKIHAPPVEGKANKEIISFFSDIFKIKKSSIKIVSGQKSRKKVLLISLEKDLDPEKILSKYLN